MKKSYFYIPLVTVLLASCVSQKKFTELQTLQDKTKDLLNFIPFPGGSALSNADFANIGEMENKGVELSLNIAAIKKEDLNLDIALNATYTDTEITKLTTNDDPSYEGVETGGFTGGVGNTIQSCCFLWHS